MNRLIWKLQKRELSVGQLVGYVIVAVLGIIVLVTSVEAYMDVNSVIKEHEELMPKDYVVIGKQTSSFQQDNGMNTPVFTQDEIKSMSQQKFVEEVAPFTSSMYHVNMFANDSLYGIHWNMACKLTSLPNNAVHISPLLWHFQEKDKIVPLILPQDMVDTYNHVLSDARETYLGIRELSKVPFVLQIGSDSVFVNYKAKVVGISSDVTSILVPEVFMNEMNRKWAAGHEWQGAHQLLLGVKDDNRGTFRTYLENNHYQLLYGDVSMSQMGAFSASIMTWVIVAALIIVLLSIYILCITISNMVGRGKEMIQKLCLLGFGKGAVLTPWCQLVFLLNLLVALLAFAGTWLLRSAYRALLGQYCSSCQWSSGVLLIIVLVIIFSVLLMVLDYFVIVKRMRKIEYTMMIHPVLKGKQA